MRLRYDPRARGELREAIEYLEDERPGLGREFAKSLADLFAEIASLPASGTEIVPGVRTRRLLRFHYTVVYQFGDTEVRILAVAHDHRQPGYWAMRPLLPGEVREGLPSMPVMYDTTPGTHLRGRDGRGERITHRYEAIIRWSEEDGIFVAEVPNLPGCMAHGETREEARHEAGVAVSLWLDTAKEFRRIAPAPRGSKRMYA